MKSAVSWGVIVQLGGGRESASGMKKLAMARGIFIFCVR